MTGDGLSPPLLGQVECDWVRKAALGSVEQALRPCLVAAYGSWCRSEGSSHQPDVWFHILVEAVRQEAKSVEDLVSLSAFALGAEVFAPTETAMLTLQDQWASPVLTRCLQTISDCALHTPESANTYLRSLCHHFRDTVGIRGRQVMSPLRSALTGTLRGPCLGVVTSLLGASRCRSRIEEALACKQVS